MQIYELLREHQLSVTTAESCTGGLVASALVDISGISEFFKEGYITYAAESKEALLNVPATVIKTYGVVSEQTAEAMARGAAERAHAACAITTTGVAGPAGGTKETPVGTVCFGCSVNGHLYSDTQQFTGDRSSVRHAAAAYAIAFLERCIEKTYGGNLCES